MKRPLLLLSLLLIALLPISSVFAQQETPEDLPVPQIVAIAGSFQPDLGCGGEWNTDCEDTYLSLDGNSLLWRATWEIPAGSHEYKVALNGTWTDNFGLGGVYYGDNIPLELAEPTLVTFFYSHETHWVTDSANSIIANVPGSFQDEIGCAGDWAPDCLRSWLQDPDGDGVYEWSTTWIPEGDYEAKVAVAESWTENYGADGELDGGNIGFSVGEAEQVTFTWDSETKVMTIATAPAPEGAATSPPAYNVVAEKPQPGFVTIPGTIQSVLGCAGDWEPDCSNTFLTLDPADKIWKGEWDLPAGSYEYKAAINQSWDLNFGQNAEQGGANIPLEVPADQTVKFYYDHQTGFVTDSINSTILTVIGDFQTGIGCKNDNDASCLRTWLQDANGDGIFSALVREVPQGTYTASLVADEFTESLVAGPAEFTIADESGVVFFEYNMETNQLKIAEGEPKGDLATQKAYWVLGDTIAWDLDPEEAASFELFYAADGGLTIEPAGLEGSTGSVALTLDEGGLPDEVTDKFPHLKGLLALKVNAGDLSLVPEMLRGQIAVVAYNENGTVVDITGLQIPGVLDDLFTYDGPLGLVWKGDIPSFHVWAPTAASVRLNVYNNPGPRVFPISYDMERDDTTGVWHFTDGQPNWNGRYYTYEVTVYVNASGGFEQNVVTDPYSVGLTTNAVRSQIIDLSASSLKPGGWNEMTKPELAAPEDIVLYELHVRDFSINDATVPEALRGTFAAFTVADSNGMRHLRALAQAGLTHIHLLPVFDFASVNEDKTTWTAADFAALSALPPDSEEQQAAISDEDPFNWGYDPVHYGVPDGSYTTDPETTARITEFREMVQALNEAGLRVVMDVVYNHTNASGQRPNSILDKIVPGYYHRLNDKGTVETSTCCQNTATEHNMMRKLMIDTLVTWATEYKVDAFRFDLMGHHMVDDMAAVQDALHAVDPSIYVYGEGWDFGEVAGGRRGVNATQTNVGGLGIGTFNDRVRDSVRGGSPFGGYTEQGFATGLFTDPNETAADPAQAQEQLFLFADRIRVALAGNLADYTFIDSSGNEVTGSQVDYNGSPTGYTQDPQEHIIYISAHDNETWFDAVQFKAPASATPADRVRMHNLGLSIVAYAQGVPFFHAGTDMLRSKSFDRDSYNSGDWFNRLDFTYQNSGWGSGLPVSDKNKDNWEIMAPLLANPDIAPAPENIMAAVQNFRELLQIRASSPLFRLQTAEEVQNRVFFHNTGPDQIPGVIVMSISDMVGNNQDPIYGMVFVIFNGTPDEVDFENLDLSGREFVLHPVLANSFDELVRTSSYDSGSGTFTVPGRTTAVFVLPESGVGADEGATEAAAEDTTTGTSSESEATPDPDAPREPDVVVPEGEEEPANNTGLIVGGLGAVVLAGLGAYVLRRRNR